MEIREMSKEECRRGLAGTKLARLACAHENQPYVIPVCLAYDEASNCLYGVTTAGQKVEWMRANPLVCIEVDEIAAYDQWVSIIVFGRYEELPETPGSESSRLRAPERPRQIGEAMSAWATSSHRDQWDDKRCHDERERAWQVININPVWGEPDGIARATRAHRGAAEPFHSVFYKIRIDSVTGYEATRDARDAMPAPPAGRWDLLRGTLTRLFGGRSKEAASTS